MPSELILIVDDCTQNHFLLGLAFKKAGITNPVQVASSGEEAIDYLSGGGKFTDWSKFPLPGVVLLDLKMPRIDGFGVLRWIRGQESLKKLRVIVMTSSGLQSEITKAYDLGANSFLTTPLDFDKLAQMMRVLKDYWFGADQAPSVERRLRCSAS